jgi:hypothetical protein
MKLARSASYLVTPLMHGAGSLSRAMHMRVVGKLAFSDKVNKELIG